jgi:hypothetical protein
MQHPAHFLLAQLNCHARRVASLSHQFAAFSTGPKTATPPPDTARGATADLCDVHVPEPVDQLTQRKVGIVEPALFQ